MRGRVKFWRADKGWGFVISEDDGQELYFHNSGLAVGQGRDIADGSTVSFDTGTGRNGKAAAVNVAVTGGPVDSAIGTAGIGTSASTWTPGPVPLFNFASMGPSVEWLQALAEMAEPEVWSYRLTPSPYDKPILHSYLRYTFSRLEDEEKVKVAQSGRRAAFNTGLVTRNQEEIFAYFVPNPVPAHQPWRLKAFVQATDREFLENFGAALPELANYFTDPSVLLYDRRLQLHINIDHILEHMERFPESVRDSPFVARQLVTSAESNTKKRVYRNYKTAIPQFYQGKVQLLLPLCLQKADQADLALVVSRIGDAYRGDTVLTLDMAYNNARLLARPDNEWLVP